MHKKAYKKNRPKKIIKKKKPKLSVEYLNSENEISNLLEKKTKDTTTKALEITLEDEIDFFTSTLKKVELSSSSSSQSDSIKDNENVIEEPHSPAAKSDTQPLSSYIQIDDIINPVYSVGKLKVFFKDDELLGMPSSDERMEHFCGTKFESLPDDGIYYQTNNFKKSKNMNRMVNRFNEEGNSTVLTASGILRNLRNFTPDSNLYKTEIERKKVRHFGSDVSEKRFMPIYVLNKSNEIPQVQIESRKLLSFVVRELKFDQHPLQTEEHHLANKLENLFKTYQEITSRNLLSKINLELSNIRNIIKNYMGDPKEEDLENIEMLMRQNKELRKKLHREELTLKTCIQNSLETWKLLKNCRKLQQFNYTDIKLIIKVEEIEDIHQDEMDWNKRYQIELAEVLREEFEKFYKTKRNKKTKDANNKFFHKPDIEIIKMDVKQILKNCTRLPGEPKIQIDCHRLEDRCKNLSKFTDYYFDVFFDNALVGTSKIFKLESNFNIKIDQSFGVYLEKKMPIDIKIKIFEKSKMGQGKKIALIQLPLHNTIDYSSGHCETIEFSSAQGSKISGAIKIVIYFDTNLKFAIDDKRNKLTFPKSKVSEHILKNWYNDKLINPLDPDCLSLIKNLEESPQIDSDISKTNKTFTFNEELLTFCSSEELQNDERLKWLKYRHQNDMRYKDLKFVPVLNNEFEEENDIKVLDEGDWISPIDFHKHKGKTYINNLYDVILNHTKQLNKRNEASNILIGDEVPTLRSFITNMSELIFGPKKSLNPPKTTFLPISTCQSRQLQNFNVIVNVIRATGVPIRNLPINASGDSNESISGRNMKYGNVRPFINLTYKDKSLRTAAADGSNPTWNEQLVLKLNGFNLHECNDDLKLQIFDEYIEDLVQDDNDAIGLRSMEVYQRIHTNYLGEYRIPISTVFNSRRVEGVFELNIPKLVVGYVKPSLDPQNVASNPTTIPIENNFEIRDSINLWLFISIEPQFEFPTMQTNFLECAELKEVKMHIYEEWVLPIKELYPAKYFDPLICLESGKRVCITRLLESIVIPFEDSENLEQSILRYISLIPVIKSSSRCVSLKGVWLKNQTILDTTWASSKDLGVLLACFYLNLGIRCWLILGISYPYGDCAYVLIQENGNYVLIDPTKGKKYLAKDVNCPLVFIYCAVGQENIYCNIQRENRISLLDFNLNDSSIWLPLFNSKNPAPIGGVHKLDYEFKKLYNTSDLRKTIERKIIKKINTWRSTRKTIWNRAFYHILYDILVDLEQDVTHDRVTDNYLERISTEFPNYKIFGFTLNFPYTNLSFISDRIRSTLIYSNTDPTVEFSAACYLHQYPNNIISCWIFLITATPVL